MARCLGYGAILGVSFGVGVVVLAITMLTFRYLNGSGAAGGASGIMGGIFMIGGLIIGVACSIVVSASLILRSNSYSTSFLN